MYVVVVSTPLTEINRPNQQNILRDCDFRILLTSQLALMTRFMHSKALLLSKTRHCNLRSWGNTLKGKVCTVRISYKYAKLSLEQ
jgi:hypothetical protein